MKLAEKPSPKAADEHGISEAAVATDRAPFQSADLGGFDQDQRARPAARGGRTWWVLAAVSALVLTALTVAAFYLATRKPSTVDQVVILTVPSGAEIKLDSQDYGHSPVKLERLKIGTYTLTITKEGFEPIVEPITVIESGLFDYKLKPVLPSEAIGLSTEEQLKQFQQRAEEAFARGFYGLPYEGSALYFADLIKSYDANNSFALDMRERVRKAAHQSAQTAVARGDLAQAQEIYRFLTENYSDDEEARVGAGKVESQLAARRGELRELVRKADEALKAGHLTDPPRASAYYYSKQALAIDRQNERARQISNQVKETLATASEQAYARGDADAAIKQFEQAAQLFPEDKQLRSRAREIQAARAEQTAKANDPGARRVRGLDEYRKGNFGDAIPDLESALTQGQGGAEVIFALARSHQMKGHYDQATSYFRSVPAAAGDAYVSSIAALGEIAYAKGDSATAVERYKEARQLGGSALYTVPMLEDKIEVIEKRQREKAAEPTPLTINVRHLHGLLGGSDSGTLTVSASGVVYEGRDDHYSYNLSAVQVRVTKDEMVIQVGKDSQKFKVAHADAERFREMLTKYQGR
ncbi:MAG TPA: PEGA domain-containing protein [Blastocatellia bacterium]|nr:PEGA domain-containing protein [Blastocatellia bacterium]